MSTLFRVVLCVCMVVGFAQTSEAQLPATASFDIRLSPEFPRPYDEVTATLESFSLDLLGSKNTYYVDGKESPSISSKSTKFRVGPAGSRTSLLVQVVVDGVTYDKEIFIYPAEVALILESDSTTPAFYKGGKLPAEGGTVRVVAVPNLRDTQGVLLSSDTLVFEWRFGDKILKSDSGLGRNVLTAIAPPKGRDADITVTVRDAENKRFAYASILIAPTTPFVRIYRNDPLLGILTSNAILDSFKLLGDEESFSVSPYFFARTPEASWTVGNTSVKGPSITVRRQGTGKGGTQARVQMTDLGSYASADSSFSVLFDAVNNTSLFNL